ncbi:MULTISPECIES: magnesium transporter [Helcobacillus]|uniref:Magnesium transporter MgtE n=1 Tax=Helcobacillus massiliensis TaxID=521392 RepID=A0A839R339_9MICO|nr:magnesium transporter [Helcobacillus massiliensis]MBB3023766.1 magnesium transporter [Helcobacillus massiliensis]MCG7426124.1 magnesium transporter [Helcobacillus sp. ACRRO]MDK7741446.1 magnesium transporter [Helcobacillus massiliensis]WOO92432.1 magnesium transporter [Helcobacillus massiliensis]
MATDILTCTDRISRAVAADDLAEVSALTDPLSPAEVTRVLERLPPKTRAVTFRLLRKDRASIVFDSLDPALRAEIVTGMRSTDVTQLFEELDPDDRVWLLEEMPASVATKLLHGLSPEERRVTDAILGYAPGTAGRRMSPEFVSTHPELTVAQTMLRITARLQDAETVYLLPVLDDGRRVQGVVSMRALLGAPSDTLIGELMREAITVPAGLDEESAARRIATQGILAAPVVDLENRVVGIMTLDDAARIVERAEDEDTARQGGTEPLDRPYLSTPIRALVRTRIVWLLVLAVGATLTVQVLEVFESTIEQVTVLALFVPLLIGIGGNMGNQAATTVTRALALDDVEPRDVLRVFSRELRTGLLLGVLLGALGFVIAGLFYSTMIGLVIGLTLVALCSVAASVGGVMPIIARALKVDPAVFSNPFISTFVDASGLVIYFVIAKVVLGL